MTTHQQEATGQAWGVPKTVCKQAPNTGLSAVEGTGAWEFPVRRMARARAGRGREKAGRSLKGHVAWGQPRRRQGFHIQGAGVIHEQMSRGHFVFHGCKRESGQGQGRPQKASCRSWEHPGEFRLGERESQVFLRGRPRVPQECPRVSRRLIVPTRSPAPGQISVPQDGQPAQPAR